MKHLTALAALAFLFFALPLFAHEGAHESDEPRDVGRVLGTIEFPTSTDSPEAQNAFIEGMLLLHLFEYAFAERSFQMAREIDPEFAMAYWGEAMVHNHPIWDQQKTDKAIAVLNQFAPSVSARADKLANQKEKDFFKAVEILYGTSGSGKTKGERDRAYERHLSTMAKRYPDDHEVQLFFALALMGTGAGVRDIPAYMESAAISQRVFYANRQHPGAAHYYIHGVDDPIHAPLGLEAARALYGLAPDAGHSLHMTSHIFVALGMWEDVVEANVNADRVADAMRIERGNPARNDGHYNFWLLYGLLQQGRTTDAKALLEKAYSDARAAKHKPASRVILDPDRDRLGSMVQMWARFMLETGGTDEDIAGWQFSTEDAFDPNLNIHYVKGMLATSIKDAQAHLDQFNALKSELGEVLNSQSRMAPTDQLYLNRLDVIEQELLAHIARLDGNLEQALLLAKEASRLEGSMPYSFGPPFVDYPSAQLVGQIAESLGHKQQARMAYSEQLKRSRNRRQAVTGLERLDAAN